MKRIIKNFLNIFLFVALVICSVMLFRSITENVASQKDYDEANDLAGTLDMDEIEETRIYENAVLLETEPESIQRQSQESAMIPDDPNVIKLLETDLTLLRQENEDVVGWIAIPDTKISYPLLQWTDNKFYLEHTWKQTPNGNGSIFIEYQNSPDFTDFNTIIYGHNMQSGAMFGTLRNYKNKNYWEEHPAFYIVCDQGILRYDIFAVHEVGTDTIIYGLDLETEKKREAFIRFATDYSCVDTGLKPTVDDKIVTLSTCAGQGRYTRWVVQGLLNKSGSYINEQ